MAGLPGDIRSIGPGTPCDRHASTDAVARLQGETDSMGCEYHYLCKVCLDEHRDKKPEALPCERCGGEDILTPVREIDEGMSGPVYHICTQCLKAKRERDAKELDYDDGYYY